MERFRKDQNLIDTLLPELTGEEAPAIFGHNKWLPVYKALATWCCGSSPRACGEPTAWSRWGWRGWSTRV